MSSGYVRTLWQYQAPQHGLSRLAGKVCHCQVPWFKNWLITSFIRRYEVDMTSAVQPDPSAYPDFNSFFTRALKPELRPIVQEENAIACPVDGVISQLGQLQADSLLQAKGFSYSVQQLLGDSECAAPFINGHFVTLYLAPKDYHRVHMPVTGRLQQMIYIPGRLFSVNANTTQQVPNLFTRNERVVSIFATNAGPMAIVLVGAMLVASISTAWAGIVAPNRSRQLQRWHYDKQSIELKRGEEMGHFQLGSTVIVLFANNKVQWETNVGISHSVCFGQPLGKLL